MAVKVVAIGKTVASYLKEGESEYLKRLGKYGRFDFIIVNDVKKKFGNQEDLKIAEAEKLSAHWKPNDFVVGLDEKGKELNNLKLAEFVNEKSSAGGDLVFVVGGAYGLSNQLRKDCNYLLSLSQLTFSHQMVRLILLEQLYRSYSILNNEPYHHM
jgi:23S rRNA (pseudouridine1915-N3)-methyltransferase